MAWPAADARRNDDTTFSRTRGAETGGALQSREGELIMGRTGPKGVRWAGDGRAGSYSGQ